MSHDGLAKFLRRFGEQHYIYRQGETKILTAFFLNQPHIRPDNANVDSETFVSAVPVGGQGRVYFSASVARHPLPPPSRAPLSAMEALTSMPPACPPVWLQGAATPQSPAGHHSLQSNKTEHENERNLYLLYFPLSLHKKRLWSKCLPKTHLP